jgi:hypothetical protein
MTDDEDLDNDMCPDSNEHPTAHCYRYGCPEYVAELEALAPWGTSRQGLKGWTE